MSQPASRDRRALLLAEGAQRSAGAMKLNGIDYVEVAPDQTELYVHFLNTVPIAGTFGEQPPVTITGGEVIQSVPVQPIDEASAFSADNEQRPILTLSVAAPGDFSTYRLTINSTALDPFFSSVAFSFKASCPTDLDCESAPPACPQPPCEPVAIDYLAKDFSSFTQALSEFSASRYPGWLERSEADLGMVMMEALAALADELSYLQDRVSAEASIVTATQRLSVLRHARLVDYEPAPATAATALLQLDLEGDPETAQITTPLHCRALAADGSTVDFEVGEGLANANGEEQAFEFPVSPSWNRYKREAGVAPETKCLPPYWLDDSAICLPAGATELYVEGHGHEFQAGQQLLLDTSGSNSAEPPVREIVTLSKGEVWAVQTRDELLEREVTKLLLDAPSTLEHDLSRTVIAGNLVPAVQGLRRSEQFYIPPAPPGVPAATPAAVVRFAANSTPPQPQLDYRYCLSGDPLAWISTSGEDAATATTATPEILITSPSASGELTFWRFARWLLDAEPGERVFTLTPERYSPVLSTGAGTFFDYDGDEGSTVRFGDGVFGERPAPGTVFTVLYRVGGGVLGNVPADTIVDVAPGQAALGKLAVVACTNPFPASGGQEAETIAQVADRAPQKFAAEPLRVVQAADYAAAAQSLPFVQQAGSTFRWTGSWFTVFTSANPSGSEQPTPGQMGELTELLDRLRLAGGESYVLPPRYVSVELWLTVCAEPSYFASDVEAAVLTRLRPGPLPDGGYGFFDHSRWSFGQPLEPSALFAAVQSCTGVAGVYAAQYRERGVQLEWSELPEAALTIASDQLLRLDDDPSRPEAGSLTVTVEGGK